MKERGQVGARVRELRQSLGLSQSSLADAGGLKRVEVVHVENGDNKASSARMRRGLAIGLGLSREDMDALLDGNMSVAQALRRSKRRARTGTDG